MTDAVMTKLEIIELFRENRMLSGLLLRGSNREALGVLSWWKHNPDWLQQRPTAVVADQGVQQLALAGVQLESVAGEGGDEGAGSDVWEVYKVTTPMETFYLQFNGYYASYTGIRFERVSEVVPREVTVTKYFDV